MPIRIGEREDPFVHEGSSMIRLSDQFHWDAVYTKEGRRSLPRHTSGRTKNAVKKLLGEKTLRYMSNYSDFLLWEVIFPEYFHLPKKAQVVEIGSAPGDFLVKFSKQYDCVPYGVEYSDVGVGLNRATFERHGFDPNNVIHADFFDEKFRRQYFERFDVVFSKGFIEHFTDMQPLLDRHLDLLKPGGYLLVDVPNFRGVNLPLAKLFDRGAIPRHNIEIMRSDVFEKLFNRPDLEKIACGYYGTFSFYLFTSDRHSRVRQRALDACHKLQPILNLTFRSVFGRKRVECGAFSPFLQYIGRKAGG